MNLRKKRRISNFYSMYSYSGIRSIERALSVDNCLSALSEPADYLVTVGLVIFFACLSNLLIVICSGLV